MPLKRASVRGKSPKSASSGLRNCYDRIWKIRSSLQAELDDALIEITCLDKELKTLKQSEDNLKTSIEQERSSSTKKEQELHAAAAEVVDLKEKLNTIETKKEQKEQEQRIEMYKQSCKVIALQKSLRFVRSALSRSMVCTTRTSAFHPRSSCCRAP